VLDNDEQIDGMNTLHLMNFFFKSFFLPPLRCAALLCAR
jgi:hypothetical protein